MDEREPRSRGRPAASGPAHGLPTACWRRLPRARGGDAFPQRWPRPLFDLAPGEAGVYRANFRFVSLSRSSQWWYSDWIIRVGFEVGTPWPEPIRHIDDRVSLYGN